MNKKRINYINEYLKQKFGERTLKICIDGNFTCPNRDGTCGYGGCIFCSEQGSGEHIKKNYSANKSSISANTTSITRQLTEYFSSTISCNI